MMVSFCSCEDEINAKVSINVLAGIKSPDGEYSVSYDRFGDLEKINYLEGSASFDYTFHWNQDTTVLTREEFFVNDGKITQTIKFFFGPDSTITKVQKNVGDEYSAVYDFQYLDKKLSGIKLVENGLDISADVYWTNDVLNIQFSNGHNVVVTYATNTESSLLNADPIISAALLEKELPIYHTFSRNQLISIDDSYGDASVEQMDYVIQEKKLISVAKDGNVFSMMYNNISVDKK